MKRYVRCSDIGGRYYLVGWDVGDFAEVHSFPTLATAIQGADDWCCGLCDIEYVPAELIDAYENGDLSSVELQQFRRWHGPNFTR